MKRDLNDRGITLIALLVTMIILIILFGVIVGIAEEDGLIGKADRAVNIYMEEEVKEKEEFDDAAVLLDLVANNGKISKPPQKFIEKPDNYKHPEQSETNKDRAVGTDGKPVNMDLWRYQIIDEEKGTIDLTGGGRGSGWYYVGYLGGFTEEGKIIDAVPQYIKVDGYDKIFTVIAMSGTFDRRVNLMIPPEIPKCVLSMNGTFFGCTALNQTPEIPDGVTSLSNAFESCKNLEKIVNLSNNLIDMSSTFCGCEKLRTTPRIPEGVTQLVYTFQNCTSLVEVINLPDTVVDMKGTFYGCTSLKKIPKLPNNLKNMLDTFMYCTNLTTVSEIPSNVTNMSETFWGCLELTGKIKIFSKEVDNFWMTFCSVDKEITLLVPANSNTYDNCTKNFAPNIHIETFEE